MTSRRPGPTPRAARGSIVLVAAATAALTACTATPEVPAPGQWGDSEGGLVTLYADGSGELEGVPYATGPECGTDPFALFDGEVEWEETEPGTLHVRADEVAITLWADRGGFGGDISWWKITVGPCGDETTGAEVLRYTRDTTFGQG